MGKDTLTPGILGRRVAVISHKMHSLLDTVLHAKTFKNFIVLLIGGGGSCFSSSLLQRKCLREKVDLYKFVLMNENALYILSILASYSSSIIASCILS